MLIGPRPKKNESCRGTCNLFHLGRRRLEDSDADKVVAIVAARAAGTGIRRIARELGVGVGTVLRLTEAG